MAMGELDRLWWRRFAGFLATALLLATLLSPCVVSVLIDKPWRDTGHQSLGILRPQQDSHGPSPQDISVAKLKMAIFGLGWVLQVVPLLIYIYTAAEKRDPPELILGDSEFEAACLRSAWRTERLQGNDTRVAEPTAPVKSALKILGVPPEASPALIRRAYRKLMLTHHPDRGGDPAIAREIIDAYRLLREQNRV
jgi:hypothetical protein